MKRGGGRRYYRPDDVDLLRGVRHLLYGEGYTIRGVQRILREEGAAFVQDVWRAGAEPPPPPLDEDIGGRRNRRRDRDAAGAEPVCRGAAAGAGRGSCGRASRTGGGVAAGPRAGNGAIHRRSTQAASGAGRTHRLPRDHRKRAAARRASPRSRDPARSRCAAVRDRDSRYRDRPVCRRRPDVRASP